MLGDVEIVGDSADRLKRIMARAWRNRASATFRFWLETVSSSSSALSCGSPKISHHLPRSVWSPGWAGFQPSTSLKDSGGCSLNPGAMGTVGLTYFGPTMH